MIARLFRSLLALGAVVVAYQAYALLVARAIEPSIKARKFTATTVESGAQGRDAVGRYQKLLANYLPEKHWALVGSPKVLESGSMLLVIDDYKTDDRGRVDLTKCVALLFPTDRAGGAPQDAVIFEAPGGARLQFDENFQPTRGRIGKIVIGEFPGPVTIRSKMRKAGPEDDLLITTRDLRMNETIITSAHEVHVRHGANQGGGKRLEIRLLEEEDPRSSGIKIAGIESIEILEDVRLSLQLGKINPLRIDAVDRVAQNRAPLSVVPRGRPVLTAYHHPATTIRLTAAVSPGEDASTWGDGPELAAPQTSVAEPRRPSVYEIQPAPKDEPLAAPRRVAPEPPLEVSCTGPFRMDFTNFTATFRQNVYAWQLNLGGQSDQLTCNELRLSFGAGERRRQVIIDPRNEPDIAQRQERAMADLQPRRIEAVGNPVKIDSPSRGVVARGRTLSFDFATRGLSLAGEGAMISRQGSYVQAPLIRYEHPADADRAALGKMWVAGPGRLRAAPKESTADDTIEAKWGQVPGVEYPVQLLPGDQGQSVLTVLGRPQLTSAAVGRLTADRLKVLLQQTSADGKQGPALELGDQSNRALLAERIDATGRVEVESPRLSAATETLTVWLLPDPHGDAPRGGGKGPLLGAKPASERSPSNLAPSPSARTTYRLIAKKTQLEVLLSGERSQPRTLTCEGDVRFHELAAGAEIKPGEEPLRVEGQRLRVDDLHTGAVRLTIHGAAAGPNDRSPLAGADRDDADLAMIAARGVTLHARDAHLDQGKNRLWADGRGDAHLRTTRDFLGQKTDAATDLHLSWRGGWVFDGRRITVRDQVLGEGPHDWVRTDLLVATLTRPVKFGEGAELGAIEVEQVDCRGGVRIDHRGVDQQGQTSQEQAQLATLSINQVTGNISGDGPGWIRSVRLSDDKNPFAKIAAGDSQARPTANGNTARLALLKIHFQGSVAGNLKIKKLQFRQRVRAVYGPVIAWQQDLPLEGQGPLLPDTATLSCQTLQVAEDPYAQRQLAASASGSLGPLELIATGGVRLEGAAKDGGAFNATAATASYNQAKELFILQGDSVAKAELWMQKGAGQGASGDGTLKHTSAKVSYWRKTGIVQTENFGATGYRPTATRPTPPTR